MRLLGTIVFGLALLALYLWLVVPVQAACPTQPVVDAPVLHITQASDVDDCRAALINAVFGATTLPTTLPTSVTTIANPGAPISGYNLARTDQYTISGLTLSVGGADNTTHNLYVAATGRLQRVVIVNPGHQDACDWTTFSPNYGITNVQAGAAPSLLSKLLSSGYDVFAMNMPGISTDCGSTSYHCNNVNGVATNIKDFLLPAIEAINYWQTNTLYKDINIAGLSGGGWTTTFYAALDPRIHIAVQVAGNMPGLYWVPMSGFTGADNVAGCANKGEQDTTSLYTIAGYLDIYFMAGFGSAGPGLSRLHQQILNQGDNCCFGSSEWTNFTQASPAFNFQTYYSTGGGGASLINCPSCTWTNYLAAYSAILTNANGTIGGRNPATLTTNDVPANTNHTVSPFSRDTILSLLNSNPPAVAAGGGVVRRR